MRYAIALASLLAGATSAIGQPPPPDPATLVLPDMTPTRDAGDIRNGWKHFYFHRAGVSYSDAYADFAECYRFLPGAGVAGATMPMFRPWVESLEPGPLRPARPNQFGLVGAAILAIVSGPLERRSLQSRMRRCMEPRGYVRYPLRKEIWEQLIDDYSALHRAAGAGRIGPGAGARAGVEMRLLLALASILMPALAHARAPREMVEIRAGAPVSIRADRAYLLIRVDRPEGVHSFEPVFLRIPTADEMARYAAARRAAWAESEPALIRRRQAALRAKASAEAQGQRYLSPIPPMPRLEDFDFPYDDLLNVQNIEAGRAFVRGRPESIFLVEVIPGDYVLYGVAWEAGPGALAVCMCLGTVGFSAQAGVVTDLGQFVADTVHEESRVPEIRPESGFGPSSYGYLLPIGATVRPPRAGNSMPDALRGTEVRAVEYRAVGKFFEPGAMSINRLVPVPGVLAYDGGRVIDVRTGRVAPDIE